MVAAILGKKIGMTRVYDDKGVITPVTVVQTGTCYVTQVKTQASDKYDALQIGFDAIDPKNSTMPLIGHCAKAGLAPYRTFAEVRTADAGKSAPGDAVTVEAFQGVRLVDVSATSKGKGFAGVMKRHHFGGQCASHGTERKHRSPGSIASRATARGSCGKPRKGIRMAGHMGAERVTTRNLRLVRIDSEQGVLLIKGTVPGANGGIVYVRSAKAPRPEPKAPPVSSKAAKAAAAKGPAKK